MTNPSPHLSDDDLVLLYYGETGGPDRDLADAHLRHCARCRDARAHLADMLEMVSEQLAAGEATPDGLERRVWARLQPDIEKAPPVGWGTWARFSRFAVPLGAAAMLAVAFLAGRWSGTPVSPGDTPAMAVASPDGVLLAAAGDHLDRTQMVLAELLRADTGEPVSETSRARAADLVWAGRLIRQTATEAGESGLADVLEDLERVLIEVANGEIDSAAALEQLKARIESRGLLFRARVVGGELRERVIDRGQRLMPPVS